MSPRWKIDKADIKRVGRNALIFTAPVIITILGMIQQGISDPEAYRVVVQVWALGVGLDFFRKLQADNTK